MLFREFSIIAAAAYAAKCASEAAEAEAISESGGVLEQRPERPLWDELGETTQNAYMQDVMAIARGEATTIGAVFEATAKAILDYNGGQGGLALEELAAIANEVLNLELLTEDDVAGRNARQVVIELLVELAGRRKGDTTVEPEPVGEWPVNGAEQDVEGADRAAQTVQ